ncbi:MAG: WbuC family cupin fold metalloprotein [Acidobacteria bacterium]|nr:WbuC family cupin fold metalloprotein [Acidobacteriota bacterium]
MQERKIQTITKATLDALLEEARQLPRLRAIQRLHDDDWEHAHRMLNALVPGTYVRPHRHQDKYKGEGFMLLRGRLAVLIFDEAGALNQSASCVLSQADGCFGMDISPGVWHSLVALEASVIYEVKGQPAGGYVQDSDKDFAPWSPPEGDVAATDFVKQLETMAQQQVKSEK